MNTPNQQPVLSSEKPSAVFEDFPPLPIGWGIAKYCESPVAVCPEGLVHYCIDGVWMLYVPWFRGAAQLPVLKNKDGEDVMGAIDNANTITTPGGRVVTSRNWYH